ncbi:unnamed protein product [Symbiodinium necroappetens]|uniref:Uncharacterized protein n=1 Tax=Symbiodinium necroappetens TaxID=1628268 RepID=A0A813B7T3_9DINO|nr:unnamed protein product [Symbiodinium necroappetens]
MAFMRECWPRRPFRRQSFRLVGETLEQSLQKVPGLLAPIAAPSDVLAGSLHRVIDEEPPLQPSHLFRHHSSPAELASLASGQALHKQPTPEHKAWLVFLFVLLDASKSIAVSHAAVHGRMCAPLVIAWKNALSIGLGLALALGRDGLPGFRNCLAMRRGFQVLPIAAAFGFAQLCAMKALRFYDAGSLKVIAQVNLPLTALLSWLLLDRRYSAQKWLAVGLMLVTNVAFLQVRMLVLQPQSCREELCDDSLFRIAPKVLGMFYFLLGIAVSCSASIFAEKFLKKWPEEPFYILKTNLMIGELILAVLGVINNFSKEDSADEDNDSCSWDQFHDWRRQLPVVLVWLLHGWIAGLLVKRCSALVKNVSHILSTLATYGYALLTHALPFSWPVTQAGVLVLLAVLNFASTSDQRGHKESRRKRSRSVDGLCPLWPPMPRKPQRSTTNAAERSDEDILRQRRRIEAVQTADFIMLLLSWHLWLLALIWLVAFAELATAKQSRYAGLESSPVVLFSCGQLCGSLSRLTPNGEWPAWRKPWYLAWVVVLGVMAVSCVQNSALVAGGLCGLLAAAMAWACPAGAGSAQQPKAPDASLGRGLVMIDGMTGLLLAARQLSTVLWQSGLEVLAASITALPLLMFSVALMFSSSDSSSLLVSVPSAMLHLAAAAAYSVLSMNDWTAVAVLTLALMAHLTLYLPLPLNDPESNPFYTSLRRVRHQFVRFLAQPVSGFGDESS